MNTTLSMDWGLVARSEHLVEAGGVVNEVGEK